MCLTLARSIRSLSCHIYQQSAAIRILCFDAWCYNEISCSHAVSSHQLSHSPSFGPSPSPHNMPHLPTSPSLIFPWPLPLPLLLPHSRPCPVPRPCPCLGPGHCPGSLSLPWPSPLPLPLSLPLPLPLPPSRNLLNLGSTKSLADMTELTYDRAGLWRQRRSNCRLS